MQELVEFRIIAETAALRLSIERGDIERDLRAAALERSAEQILDTTYITVRSIGQQSNYAFAEQLALDIDLPIWSRMVTTGGLVIERSQTVRQGTGQPVWQKAPPAWTSTADSPS